MIEKVQDCLRMHLYPREFIRKLVRGLYGDCTGTVRGLYGDSTGTVYFLDALRVAFFRAAGRKSRAIYKDSFMRILSRGHIYVSKFALAGGGPRTLR